MEKSESEQAQQVQAVDREILTTLIQTGAVNFEAIGKTIAAMGPRSVMLDDGWERFCGTSIQIYRWRRPYALGELESLRSMIANVVNR
jgi:hypothetical protein